MLNLSWNNTDNQSREYMLSKACMNSRLANYEWAELETWEQQIIQDVMKALSNQAVNVEA